MVEITTEKLADITHRLNETGVPWGLFGGAAAKIFGVTRPLQDIDILIPCDSGQRVSKYFPDAYLDYDADGRVASFEFPGYEIMAGLTKRIDFEMDAEMAARISHHKLLGVEIPVLSIEDNLAFKAIMGRGPEVGKYDWEDAAEMLKNAADIDWDYLYRRLQICAPENAKTLEERLDALHKRS